MSLNFFRNLRIDIASNELKVRSFIWGRYSNIRLGDDFYYRSVGLTRDFGKTINSIVNCSFVAKADRDDTLNFFWPLYDFVFWPLCSALELPHASVGAFSDLDLLSFSDNCGEARLFLIQFLPVFSERLCLQLWLLLLNAVFWSFSRRFPVRPSSWDGSLLKSEVNLCYSDKTLQRSCKLGAISLSAIAAVQLKTRATLRCLDCEL